MVKPRPLSVVCVLCALSSFIFLFNKVQAQSPGGVSGAKMWVKASNGFTYTSTAGAVGWSDQSGNSNNAVVDQGEPGQAANTPGALVNFNPAIEFDGNDMYRFATTVSSDYSILGVAQMYSTTKQRVFSAENTNILMGYHGGYDDALYINNNPNYLSGGGGNKVVPATNITHMYNLIRQTSGAYSFISRRLSGLYCG